MIVWILLILSLSRIKLKSLGNTEANGVNEILRNIAIAVPLKYLSNF